MGDEHADKVIKMFGKGARRKTRKTETTPGMIDLSVPVEAAGAILQQRYTRDGARTLHHWQGEFHEWTGTHYAVQPIGDLRELIYKCGDGNDGPVRKRHVDETLDALRALANLSNTVAAPAWITHEVDDPPPRDVIVLRNGLLDVREDVLLPASPRLFARHALPFDFDPKAPSPAQWLHFLREVFGDDAESISLLQEWFGYCLLERTEQQKALLWVAPGRGGKGTAARVLSALLGGPANVCSPTLASLGAQFGLQPMIGKLLALVSDARLGGPADVWAVAENVLRLTGEDQISIPRKYLPDYTCTLGARLMVLTNELPRFTDGSAVLPTRFLVLNTTASFYGREDPALTNKLLTELPGVLVWALDGLRRLNDRGRFVQPQAARDSITMMETLAAPVRAFLAECCDTNDPTAETPCAAMYAGWKAWCANNGREHPGTAQTFGRDLRSALPRLQSVRRREQDGERERCYVGVRLR